MAFRRLDKGDLAGEEITSVDQRGKDHEEIKGGKHNKEISEPYLLCTYLMVVNILSSFHNQICRAP